MNLFVTLFPSQSYIQLLFLISDNALTRIAFVVHNSTVIFPFKISHVIVSRGAVPFITFHHISIIVKHVQAINAVFNVKWLAERFNNFVF
jgi:hypothetical protein